MSTLNGKQKLCLDLIKQFINQSTEKFFYLLGYAGTGKTFLTVKIVMDLINIYKMDQVFICAPTHQALRVLLSYMQSGLIQNNQLDMMAKLKFLTIHKLLEFKPIIMTEDGSRVFKSKMEPKFLKKMSDKLVIIDECSMISKYMVTEITKHSTIYPIKVIFLGDEAQLPPVNEPKSIIFASIPEKYPYFILLDEIMRAKAPEIKEVATIIRNWKHSESLYKLLLSVHNQKKLFKLYHKKPNHLETTWFKNFTAKLKMGTIPIILTWRNIAADNYNQIIRSHMHQTTNLDNYIVGDYAMFNNFYTLGLEGSFYTSDMIRILEIKLKDEKLYEWKTLTNHLQTREDAAFNKLLIKMDKINNTFKVNTLVIKKIHSDISKALISQDQTYTIKTIQRPNLLPYREYINAIREHIEEYHKIYRSDYHTDILWNIYYKMLIDPYAELCYGYSITTHKGQGSTFESVFVDMDDMLQNPDLDELQHMIYTAATRCSNDLGFLI